jgi:hypothetical protein
VAKDAQAGVLGEIGEPVWARYGFQLDLKRGVLSLFAPDTKEPAGLAPAGSDRQR